jgi:drug/metabolite transporter (DMT)-like permease
MLKWACIIGIFGMGALAVAYLVARREEWFEWGRALQVALLPLWVLAVVIGVGAAFFVWNALNLTERRMIMSVAYTLVAAIALMASLYWDSRRVGAVGQIVTALAMGVGLAWIEFGPKGDDVHPSSAVLNSPNVAFKVYAFVMLAGCLLAVLSLSVPVRRWLELSESEGRA